MGCDGGSIPKRVEMIKLKKKKEKVGLHFLEDLTYIVTEEGEIELHLWVIFGILE